MYSDQLIIISHLKSKSKQFTLQIIQRFATTLRRTRHDLYPAAALMPTTSKTLTMLTRIKAMNVRPLLYSTYVYNRTLEVFKLLPIKLPSAKCWLSYSSPVLL